MTMTLRAHGVGTVWDVLSYPGAYHVFVSTGPLSRRCVREFLRWDEAAFFVVEQVRKEIAAEEEATQDNPIYCGDCGAVVRWVGTSLRCPNHGPLG